MRPSGTPKKDNSLKKRVIVIGNNGFIGSHLMATLNTYNNIELIGVSHKDIDLTESSLFVHIAQLFTPKTIVILLAAIKPNKGDGLEIFSKNMAMTMNLAQLFTQRPIERLIYVSSAAIYGEDIARKHITEHTPAEIRSYYGLAKYTSERIYLKLQNDLKIKSVAILRPPVVYGPGEKQFSYNPAGFFIKAKQREVIHIWGKGEEKREFIYISDLIKVIDFMTFSQFSGIVNVASGKSYSFQNIVELLNKKLGYTISVSYKPRTKKKVNISFKPTLLHKLMPELHFTSLTQGVDQIAQYYD